MKRIAAILVFCIPFVASASENGYTVSINLNEVVDDKLLVEILVPTVDSDTVEFHIPKVVPGTYSISDFGRFISEFTAKDDQGDTLLVDRISTNRWKIVGATNLNSISYYVDDTFDRVEGYTSNIVFEPGGTSIEEERNVFVLNTFGLIGYLDGLKFRPYEVSIEHPASIYGATSLERKSMTDTQDVFTAVNYNFLADAPIMYCEPDTVTKVIAGAEIIVSVFSPNNELTAKEIMDNIDDLMEAQTKYLGGELPVDRYAYLVYLMDFYPMSGAMGALEHSYSSLYTLPEAQADQLAKSIRDIAVHEFLHIVTPLNIHSEEIHNFDYIDPEMSEHLWLYEGVTEYSSIHLQVRHGLFSEEVFLDEIKAKLQAADRFPDVSFTEMSRRILEPEFEWMFTNVYNKGALIAMCLDLHLLKYTGGQTDLSSLMQTLSERYGPNKAFKDDEIMQEIVTMTAPEIEFFFEKYVIGSSPLPVNEFLKWAGVTYKPEAIIYQNTVGNIGLDINDQQQIYVASTDEMNDFGREIGFETYDKLVSVNGEEFNLSTAADILERWQKEFENGQKIKVVVSRMVEGRAREITLKAKVQQVGINEKHFLEFDQFPTSEQRQIRDWWLNGL